MASAVDSRLAYARLSAVATASRLPTATRGSNNSYTTSWDTTYIRRRNSPIFASPISCNGLTARWPRCQKHATCRRKKRNSAPDRQSRKTLVSDITAFSPKSFLMV